MRLGVLTILAASAALGLAGPAAGGGQAPVQPGKYAGGSDRFHIYFNVYETRMIPFARVYSLDLQACGAPGGPAVFDSDTVDSAGRFTLRDDVTHAGQSFKITGRFVKKNKVRGKVRWTTTNSCPAGTYDFEYRADRYAPVQ
jgi:hypothetical protein